MRVAQATSGTITVVRVGQSSVSGSYNVTFGSDGSFGGSFSVPLCGTSDAATSARTAQR
jgi:hypothetical protein